MIDDTKETTWNHIAKDKYVSFSSSERKFINLIYDLQEKFPDEVEITHKNSDGSICAKFSYDWIRIRPKKNREMSEEQIAALTERLELGRLKRLENIRDLGVVQ